MNLWKNIVHSMELELSSNIKRCRPNRVCCLEGLLSQTPVIRHDTQCMHNNVRLSSLTLCMRDLKSSKNTPGSLAPKYTAQLPTVWRDRPWPADIWRGVRTLRVGSRRDNIDERADRTQFSTFSEEANTIKTYNYCYLVHLFAQRPSSGAEGR